MTIIELPEYGGELARRVRAALPGVAIRKDSDLGRGGALIRVTGASPEQMKILRARLPDVSPGAITEIAESTVAATVPDESKQRPKTT